LTANGPSSPLDPNLGRRPRIAGQQRALLVTAELPSFRFDPALFLSTFFIYLLLISPLLINLRIINSLFTNLHKPFLQLYNPSKLQPFNSSTLRLFKGLLHSLSPWGPIPDHHGLEDWLRRL